MKNVFALLFLSSILFVNAQVTTLATIPASYGDGMIMTPEGDILVSGGFNKDDILKITTDGVVTTHVTGLPGPVGMGFDSEGNLYVSNYTGNSISKVTPGGVVSEFASGLDGPAGLIVTDDDEIFVTLYGASFSGNGRTVLKFDLDGSSQEYAVGSGIQDAIGVTTDENDNLFITNLSGGNVFKVDTSQSITNIATIASADINQIVYSEGYIYVPSPNLRKIYRVNTVTGNVLHIAGTGGNSTTDGAFLEAQFNHPNSCAINETGEILYILDGQVGLIRALDLTALSTTTNEITDFKLQLYPNPSNVSITLKGQLLDQNSVYTIKVYDAQGRIIKEQEGKKNSVISEEIQVANWSSGTYIIEVLSGQNSQTIQFIKK